MQQQCAKVLEFNGVPAEIQHRLSIHKHAMEALGQSESSARLCHWMKSAPIRSSILHIVQCRVEISWDQGIEGCY